MNEKQIQEVMALVDYYAHVNAFVLDDDRMPRARAAIERALREQVREVPDESPGEGWDSFFEKRLPSLARAHPSLLVRQLAQRMLSAAPTQPAQAEQPKSTAWPVAGNFESQLQLAEIIAAREAEQPACGNTPYDEGPFTVAQVSQPKAAQQEPVHQFRIRGQSSWCDGLIPSNANPEDFVARTLYTAAPQREPMTPEEVREGIANHIEDVFRAEKVWTVLQTAAYIRSIEINGRHHGIKE